MAPSAQAHKRSHSLLLLQKLLNLRDNASPLTLVLDTLEQGSTPVLQEFTTRAKVCSSTILYCIMTIHLQLHRYLTPKSYLYHLPQ